MTSNILSDWDRFTTYFVRDWKPEQECGKESLKQMSLLYVPFSVSWIEAATEIMPN